MASRRGSVRLASLAIFLTIIANLIIPLAPVEAAGLSVAKQDAVVTFPTKLQFDLIADAPQPATKVEVWYHATYAPITEVSRTDFTGGAHIDISDTIDMQLHYLPPGVDIVYRWRVTLADGSVLETPEKTVFYMDNRYQWGSATSGPVTVYYSKGDDQLGQQALNTTVQSIDHLHQTFNITTNEPVRVIVYSNSDAFASALPPNSAEWIGGIAEPELHLILTAVEPGSGATSEIHRILSHESVHLVVGQATDNAFNTPPPWLDEGLATYFQEVPDPRFDPALKAAVRNGSLIPIRALNSSFPDDQNQALLSYAESESVVDFIITQKGTDKMAALLAAYKQGVSNDEAVQTGLGITIDQLDKEWKDWLGYGGDRGVTASTSTYHDNGIGHRLDDLLATSSSVLLISFAALLTLVTGAILTFRSRSSRNEEPES
jgi:hypothetical protein